MTLSALASTLGGIVSPDLLGGLQIDHQLKLRRLLRLGGHAKRKEESAQGKEQNSAV